MWFFFFFPAVKESGRMIRELLVPPSKGNLFLCLLKFEYNSLHVWVHVDHARHVGDGGSNREGSGGWSRQRGEDYPRPGKEQRSALSLSGGIWDPLHLQGGDRTSEENGCVQFQQKPKHSLEAAEPSDIRDPALTVGIKVVIHVDQRLEKLPPIFFFRMQKKSQLFLFFFKESVLFFTPEHFFSTKVLHQLFFSLFKNRKS